MLKPIFCPNMSEILEKLQATEYPWIDTGETNRHIVFAWGQEKGLEKLDFQLVRAAIHHLGPSALETKKAPVAPVAPPPPPEPPKPARFDWYSIGAGEIPLEGPDGSTPPESYLQSSSVTRAQITSLVKRQERQKKPWLTQYPGSPHKT